MGKSTAANLFREMDVPVHDADAAVHALLDFNGAAVAPLLDIFPDVGLENEQGEKAIDRQKLGAIVFSNPKALKQLEDILHPMVRARTDEFLKDAFNSGAKLVVLDIPLLYETGAEKRVDGVLVVTASADVQKARVLARPGMSEAKFKDILSRQLSDQEKRKRADFILEMEKGVPQARADLKALMPKFKALPAKAFKRLMP